jgi:hypothetical protein
MKTFVMVTVICLLASPAYGRFDPKTSTGSSEEVVEPAANSPVIPVTTKTATPPVTTEIPIVVPAVLKDTPNNPLAAPPNIDELLKLRMTEDLWQAMYKPLPCLDMTADCINRLQNKAVLSSPVLRELELKITTVNQKIEEAKTNNRKSIDLAIFEPALQVFLKQDTVVEKGVSRKIGVVERIGQLFGNPGPVVNDLLSAIGIPVLKGIYGGSDAQQSRAIQISDLVVKVAEMERGKMEVAAKTRERVQQLVLDFDIYAREFQAEQAMAMSESKALRLYAVTYAAGDGATDIYLNRKEKVERSKLQAFKAWARLRGQITNLKAVVMPRD